MDNYSPVYDYFDAAKEDYERNTSKLTEELRKKCLQEFKELQQAGSAVGTAGEYIKAKRDVVVEARRKALEDDPNLLKNLALEVEQEISKNMKTFKQV